jgi:murein DD-endopeptidase MepM/ murein hydrolase activator NlpD
MRRPPPRRPSPEEDGTDGDASYDKYLPVNGSINYEGTVNGTVQVNEELQSAEESSSEDAVDSVGSIISPVEGILSSPYGERVDPFTKEIKFHKGIDIEATKGSPIKAAADGEVVEAAVLRTYGKYVKIKHSSGVETVYAHCSEYLVKKGQKVNQGDTIAKVGDTGLSTGVHIHFELWKDGNSLNPQDFLDVPI